MRAHYSPGIPDGELPVRMNAGTDNDPFGVINLGPSEICCDSLDDARRLLAAAARVIACYQVLGTPHAYQRGTLNSHCLTCGMLAGWADHAEPEDAAPAPGEGGILLPAGCDPDAEPILDATVPAPEDGLCTATTGPDEELDRALYCDRDAGHPGSHHAPGPDEGSEVAWSDEPAQVPA